MSNTIKLTKKTYQVRKFIAQSGERFPACSLPTTDAEARELVNEVNEGDFSDESEWDKAFTNFKYYFKSYLAYGRELKEDYDREFS